jgi:hypothetical protein
MAQEGFTPLLNFVSTTPGAEPTVDNLAIGEIAINAADKKIFITDGTDIASIQLVVGSGGTDALQPILATKVDKVVGKGLSTNDFTDDYITTLTELSKSSWSLTQLINQLETKVAKDVGDLAVELLAESTARIASEAELTTTVEAYTDSAIKTEVKARDAADVVILQSANDFTTQAIADQSATAVDAAVAKAATYTDKVLDKSITRVNDRITTVNSDIRGDLISYYELKQDTVDSLKLITDKIDKAAADATTYVNTATAKSLADAKTYTDTGLSGLHTTITDEINNTVRQMALDAAGVVSQSILTTAGLYTDSEITKAKAYTDTKVDAELARAVDIETKLGIRIDNLLNGSGSSNPSDPNAPPVLDSLSKIVTAFQAADTEIKTSITNLGTSTLANAKAYTDSQISDLTLNAIDTAVTQATNISNQYTDNREAALRIVISDGDTKTKDFVTNRLEYYVRQTTFDNTVESLHNLIDQVRTDLETTNTDLSDLSSVVASNLKQALDYTDAKIIDAIKGDTQLIQAKIYADTQDQAILSQAHAYADTVSNAAYAKAVLNNQTQLSLETTNRSKADDAINARIDNIISNTDPAALDSLAEIVTAFQSADANLTTAITNLGSTSVAAAKTYTDSQISAAATVANAYADGKVSTEATARAAADISNLALAKTYTDNVATTTLTAANDYANSAAVAAGSGAKTYFYNGNLVGFVGTIPWIVPRNISVSTVLAYLGSPSTSNDVTIDVMRKTVKITTLTIPQASTYVEIPVSFTAEKGDQLLMNITGPGLNAANLQLVFIYV